MILKLDNILNNIYNKYYGWMFIRYIILGSIYIEGLSCVSYVLNKTLFYFSFIII